ncbi:hypothetical protein [Methanolapillus ohkumae]|uniref:Uncharacterized protein n=1 Tax=Methanolapillus ohkumae TaxID=3028298 RepID=A0AA96V4B0_9EURY|nr:hypothetical protein MsAm2_00970 [Methanosarcinaceae archaeon Am2]
MSHEVRNKFNMDISDSENTVSGWMTEKDWDNTFAFLEETRKSMKELTQQILREREERNQKNGISVPRVDFPNFTYALTNLGQRNPENRIQCSNEQLILSPAAAKILLEQLEKDVSAYEKINGKISPVDFE